MPMGIQSFSAVYSARLLPVARARTLPSTWLSTLT